MGRNLGNVDAEHSAWPLEWSGEDAKGIERTEGSTDWTAGGEQRCFIVWRAHNGRHL